MNTDPLVKSELDPSYVEQDGCWNCQHVFCKYEYDGDTVFFCTKNAPPRPLCGSVCMNERHFHSKVRSEEESIRLHDLWEAWSLPRQCREYGVCQYWERKQEPQRPSAEAVEKLIDEDAKQSYSTE